MSGSGSPHLNGGCGAAAQDLVGKLVLDPDRPTSRFGSVDLETASKRGSDLVENAVITGVPQPASDRRGPEVFVSVGRAVLIEGGEFLQGDWASLGGGVTFRLTRRVAAQFEINSMLGTKVDTIRSVRRTCRGGVCGPQEPFEYRSGTSSLTVSSASFLYYFFPDRRLQPLVGGGLGFVWRKGARRCGIGCAGTGSETEEFDTAEVGVSWSAGVRVAITPRLSITPEVKGYGAGTDYVTRASVAAGFRW